MEIFLDTANLEEIRRWLEFGVLDGVTTNPSIMLRDGGYDLERRAKEIAAVIHPRPLSVEVTTNDPQEMACQARVMAAWAPNIVVKIPVVNQDGRPCLDVVRTLTQEGVRVNLTVCLSYGQAMLGAKAGATYVSIFAGRLADEGHDAAAVIRGVAEWLKLWGLPTQIIAGSIRGVMDVQQAAQSGAHVVTAPPQILERLLDHKYSRETVRGFIDDAARALARAEELRRVALRAQGVRSP